MSTSPISCRRGAPRRGRVVGVLTTLGVLADMVVPSRASGEVLNIPRSKSPTPTYGTEHLPSPSQFSARVWASITNGNTAYFGGEFTSLAPTTAGAGALDGQTGAPQPGFPKVDNGQVNVAASDSRGGWYIGGSVPPPHNVPGHRPAPALAPRRPHPRLPPPPGRPPHHPAHA